ncbi:hypothetical protein [Ruegeria hyattellae]|uniref:hypothetical protein n=1 Tax=Ruegeria hyattellae TaxID=3233337 RepID=UPI00355B93D7
MRPRSAVFRTRGLWHDFAQQLRLASGHHADRAPLSILRDEGWLTDIRTGIGGALATQALAIAGYDQALIVGTGLQARHQAQCLQQLVPDRHLSFLIWGRQELQVRAVAQDIAISSATLTTLTAIE